VTGVGHDAVHLARHVHGLVNDNLPTDNEEEDTTEMEEPQVGLSGVSQIDNEVDEDEAGEGSDSSGSDPSDAGDSDSDADTRF
jgi:hypothetical protein